MRRWLLLLLGGTLAFGLFCFGGGLLLGIYLGGGSPVAVPRGSPETLADLAGNKQAPVVPKIPSSAAALSSSSPTAAGSPSTVAPAATTTTPTSTAPTTPAAPAAASAGATAVGQQAGPPAAVPTGGGTPAAQDALPVQPVTDLLVGLPADEEPASPLHGQLVSAAVRDQATQIQPSQSAQKPSDPAPQKQVAPGQAPGGGSAGPPAGASAVANSGTAAGAAAKPAPTSDGAAAASRRVFGIRVGAYLDPGAAQRRAETLANHGYRPLIVSSQQAEEGLTWYSVVLNSSKDLSSVRRGAAQFAQDQGQQPDIVSWNAAPAADAGAPVAARR